MGEKNKFQNQRGSVGAVVVTFSLFRWNNKMLESSTFSVDCTSSSEFWRRAIMYRRQRRTGNRVHK